MGLVPHRAAKDASLRSRSGVVAGGDEQRCRGLRADAASAQQRRVGSFAQAAQLGVKVLDLRGESLVAAGQGAQRPLGRSADEITVCVGPHPGAGLDGAGRVQCPQAVFDGLGGGHDDSVDLVGGDGAGLDRGAARHTQGPDRLDASVGALGHHCGTAVERGPRRCLRVDGVGLAAAAAHLAVRAVHIDDVDAGSREVPGEARAVGAGSLHADALDAAVAAEPSQQRRVAGGVRVERGAAQDPSGAVEDGGDMGVLVGVDPAEYGGVVLCHDGDASLWSSHCRGRHRPRRRTEHSRCGLQGSYRVTSVGPVGARPADQRKPTDPPQGTTRGRLQLGSDPLLPTGPNHYE